LLSGFPQIDAKGEINKVFATGRAEQILKNGKKSFNFNTK
jgi:hypothetical protein